VIDAGVVGDEDRVEPLDGELRWAAHRARSRGPITRWHPLLTSERAKALASSSDGCAVSLARRG
jgi:hypothetical protein